MTLWPLYAPLHTYAFRIHRQLTLLLHNPSALPQRFSSPIVPAHSHLRAFVFTGGVLSCCTTRRCCRSGIGNPSYASIHISVCLYSQSASPPAAQPVGASGLAANLWPFYAPYLHLRAFCIHEKLPYGHCMPPIHISVLFVFTGSFPFCYTIRRRCRSGSGSSRKAQNSKFSPGTDLVPFYLVSASVICII